MLTTAASRTYKILALSGYLIIAAAIIFPLKNLQSLEQNTNQSFEKVITSNLEVAGLKNELKHIEKVLSQANKKILKVDDVVYTQYEVERLRKERQSIHLFLREKSLNKDVYVSVKNKLINDIRVLFLVSSFSILIGTLMAIFGTFAWCFQLELFEDRRKKQRE